ncbi:MAG TPA: hypothetical protein VJY41_12195 [Prolixibacteraceae bacterium]|jgi:hypothetical protein|nr:hypothetical protein [Paludibacteraceae bacterium]HKM94406.1 hypothetical protein [Prolixibacteraceae bacterium]
MIFLANHSGIQAIMKKLPIDQGGKGRHKSPHAAYEQGYLDGVKQYYAKK